MDDALLLVAFWGKESKKEPFSPLFSPPYEGSLRLDLRPLLPTVSLTEHSSQSLIVPFFLNYPLLPQLKDFAGIRLDLLNSLILDSFS